MNHVTHAKHRRITTGGKHRAQTHHLRDAAAATATLGVAAGVILASGNTAHADLDWAPIIACESGGNPTAQNPSSTASGLFQFLDTSWIAYGGGTYARRAKDATPAQQYEIANRAYAQSGLTPWTASKGCWGGKSAPTQLPSTPPRTSPRRLLGYQHKRHSTPVTR